MKRVYVITGAAGHLAKAVIERLRRQDCLIRGLILPSEQGVDDETISYVKGDVTRPETLDRLFVGLEEDEIIVLHLAALISIRDEVSPALWDVNVNGTKHVLEKCVRYHVKRLLYVSSVHAIPEPAYSSVISEVRYFSRDAVEGGYAVTKAQATQMVLDAGRNGLDVVVVHPSAIIGPGDTGRNHVIQLIQMYLRRRLPVSIRGGYDFVDVRDVADGIAAAVGRGRSGECYLLTNRYMQIPELLEYVRLAAGRRFRPVCCPVRAARAALPLIRGWNRLTGTRPVCTAYSLQVLQSNGHFCHDKATMELAYHPRDIRETIADTVSFLQLRDAGTQTPGSCP